MAEASLPLQIWRLDRRDDWQRVLDRVRFSGDYNRLHATGGLRPAAPDNAAEILRAWAQPTLILHGARDMCFPVEVARRLHGELPASSLVEVPEAGHMTHFDSPVRWLAAMRRFLHG